LRHFELDERIGVLVQRYRKAESRRLWYALGVRITFATLLLITIGYGFYTGELRMGINAPWHSASAEESVAPSAP